MAYLAYSASTMERSSVDTSCCHGLIYVALQCLLSSLENQNAYIESFNVRFQNECQTEHCFTSLSHTKVVIEGWPPGVRRGKTEEASWRADTISLCQATSGKTR